MAASSCTERTNWYKCSRLLIEGGRDVLKEFLKKSCHGTLDNFLALNKSKLEYVYKRKILNQCQWKKLFPQSDIESMDITLLNCIISNCITQPSSPERTALNSIRNLRNNVYGHVCNFMMDECKFKTNWKLINDALSKAIVVFGINISLNNYIDAIEKEEVVDKEDIEHVRHELETWKRNDDALRLEISELKGEVKEHSSRISELKDEVKEHSLGMSELKGEVKEHSSGISELKGAVKEHSSGISELKGEVKEHSSGISELTGEVKEHSSGISELKYEVKEHSSGMSELKGEVKEHSSGISELKYEVKEHSSGISELKGEVKEHSSGMSELKGEVKAHSSGISELKGEVKEHSSDISELKGEVKEHSSGISKLKGEVKEHSSGMSELKGEVKEHSSGISELKGAVKEHSLGISKLQDKVKKMDDEIRQKRIFPSEGSNDKELSSPEKKSQQMYVTVKQEVISPVLVKQDMSEGHSIIDLSELRTCLVNYYKKYLLKSPVTAIASSNSETDIDEIYAEPELEVVDHTALRKPASDNPTSDNKGLISVKDIFFKDGKKCHNIYITGDAGMGKTSFCKSILSSWCKAWQTDNPIDEVEMALRQYEFLFYISLRNAIGQYDIQNMIVSQLLKYILSYNETLSGVQPESLLHELLKHFSEKCLIILDGLDEWTTQERSSMPAISNGVPGRNPALNYTIMTTARPWKLEELRLMCSEIGRQIQITGIKDSREFGMKLISHFNIQVSTNRTYTDFKQCLLKAKLTEFCKIPILLKQMICLWFKDETIGTTKTEVYTKIIDLWLLNAEKREGRRHVNQPACIDFDKNITIPGVFEKNKNCKRYEALLKSVGKLAFETTMHEKGMQLTFDSPEDYGVTEDQLKICLIVGILSKSIIPDMVCEKKSISFPHKTFHEYFAALYMGWHENIPDDILLGKNEENVLFFLSGIWPNVSGKMLKKYEAGIFGKDYVPTNNIFRECQYHKFVIDCCNESLNQNKVCLKVKLRCILFPPPEELLNWDTLRSMNCSHEFFSLMSQMHQQKILHTNGNNIMLDFSELCDLNYLQLAKLDLDSLRVNPTLIRLHLDEITICKPDGMIALMSNIAKAESLTSLTCCSIKCTNAQFTFDNDKRNSQIRNIKCREDASKEEYFLSMDLSKLTQLNQFYVYNLSVSELKLSPVIKKLTLQYIKIEQHGGIVSLMESVSCMEKLEKISMNKIQCAEQSSNGEFGLNIDLSKLTMLRNIDLRNICISKLSLSPVIVKLTLQDIKIAQHGGIVSLLASVSRMETLEIISMNKIQCAEQSSNGDFGFNIDLSKLTMLRNIDLRKICISELSLSPVIVELTLHNIKITQHCEIVSLMGSVLRMETLRKMQINSIPFTTQASNEDCFLNRDLFQLGTIEVSELSNMWLETDELTLYLRNIKSAHHAIVSLMESVSSMKTLYEINMNNIYCTEHASTEDCVTDIDLSKLSKLRKIELKNIRISELRFNTVIMELTLQNIKIAQHGGIVSLMESVSGMKNLEKIRMNNIQCTERSSKGDYGLNIDLSKVTMLRNIDLRNICISKLSLSPVIVELTLQDIKIAQHCGIVSLMESVLRMETLRKMQINNIDLTAQASNEDCFLNRDLFELGTFDVRIKNVWPETNRQTLTLKNIKLAHHAIVSLMKHVLRMETLVAINMNNIHCTEHASTEDCVMDKDLFKLPKLGKIELKNIRISELRLNPVIMELTLQDIKIAQHDGIVSLMESVSCMDNLKIISLNNIQCLEHSSNRECFLNIDLSNLKELTTITLANLTIRELHGSPSLNTIVVNGLTIANHDVLLSMKRSIIKCNSLNTIHCAEHGSDACFQTELSDCSYIDEDLSDADLSETD